MTSASAAIHLDVARVAGHIGATVTGVDLSTELGPDTVTEIRAALLEHKVLFFPQQTGLEHAKQVAFASRFGDPIARARPQGSTELAAWPQIWTISPQADLEAYGYDHEEHYRARQRSGISGWHTDLSTAVNPPAASVLRAETVPTHGGDTMWTNLDAAYDGLPAALRAFVDGLYAEHTFFAAYDMNGEDARDRAILEQVGREPQIAHHPVVRVHPETGYRSLFVNPARVARILDLTPAESRGVLDLLFAELTRPEYTVRWSWTAGDVAFWDNRNTAHLGIGDYAHTGEPRRMHRVSLLGDTPVAPDGTSSRHISGRVLVACPG
jgi:alpha-ketoglutarate-dependent taurine dioxygenase